MFFDLPFQNARVVNGVTIIGPDLFAKDKKDKALSPIATVLPWKNLLITGKGIHAMQTMAMVEYFRKKVGDEQQRALTVEEENVVFRDAVALLVRGDTVLIRSDPKRMDCMSAADELLQQLVPKESIKFTGVYIKEVREELRGNGQCWRISLPPRSVEEIYTEIRSNRVQVSSGVTYYQNVSSGERFLTYEEFRRTADLFDKDPHKVMEGVKEIVDLSRLRNKDGVRELSFFLSHPAELDVGCLEELVDVLRDDKSAAAVQRARDLFERFSRMFADAAGEDFLVDELENVLWRTTMFCRLCDISEETLEEWSLGLSPEFFLNIRWLPGARIVSGQLLLEKEVETRVKSIIASYWKSRPNLISINIGRVEASLSVRRKSGDNEHREVYLVVLGEKNKPLDIRIVRLMKWDVLHRLERGIPLDRAIRETEDYAQFIMDRLRAVSELAIQIPEFREIKISEEMPGIGPIPVFLYEREYILGSVSDRLPVVRYYKRRFVLRLSAHLGRAAARTLILGRGDPRRNHVLFDDGDEIVQFDDDNLPCNIMIAETTGSFNNWQSSFEELVPHCVSHFCGHLRKAKDCHIKYEDLVQSVQMFCDNLIAEIAEKRDHIRGSNGSGPHDLFSDYSREKGGMYSRWQGVLYRLEHADLESIRTVILNDKEIAGLLEA